MEGFAKPEENNKKHKITVFLIMRVALPCIITAFTAGWMLRKELVENKLISKSEYDQLNIVHINTINELNKVLAKNDSLKSLIKSPKDINTEREDKNSSFSDIKVENSEKTNIGNGNKISN